MEGLGLVVDEGDGLCVKRYQNGVLGFCAVVEPDNGAADGGGSPGITAYTPLSSAGVQPGLEFPFICGFDVIPPHGSLKSENPFI